jgi:CheY-like chemotaxis protein
MAKLAPILLAEDDPNDILFFSSAVKQAGLPYSLIVARDGREAIDFLDQVSSHRDRVLHPLPSLFLLDLKMPRVSGFDVLVWLRTRVEFRPIPVVVLSSSPQAPDMLISLEFGAADYRVKPANLEDYVQLLQDLRARWLERKGPVTSLPSSLRNSTRTPSPRRVEVLVGNPSHGHSLEPLLAG